ncbi:MAG: hypothetical protein M3M99_07805, partial [Actinomycetota bacterium]|nr:hypothetical protein [Actinomycetota bacterium]
LLGRYVYADSFGALSGIFSAQLFAAGSSGNAATGLTASTIVSFGEDACGHVYVASLATNTVSRIEPSGGSPACMPQRGAEFAGPGQRGSPDLSVDISGSRRAAARGELAVLVGCDAACTVVGRGEIRGRGANIRLRKDSAAATAGAMTKLRLDLSAGGASQLRRALRQGGRATAILDLQATDAAGNQSSAARRIKQRG